MFAVGDVVIYGKNGVCKVTDIGTIDLSMATKGKQYYTMHPVFKKDAILYAPVENGKTVMRSVMTQEEAEELINEIPSLDNVWIVSEKDRELQYKSALSTCDCRELVKIIKTLYFRRESRIQDGKKVTVVDERYCKLAEDQLYEELSYALKKSREELDSIIIDCL
ncbi:MAG: CarD family transcriptional regulator [Lachnospiraceae bacterium]|nr:CarD family transcriptional regulator [Candidatus Merdinaster equi]